jgi:glycosyltransferase involved in cell wall biosynthesis
MNTNIALHVIGLPHTQSSKEHSLCAYTMKHYNFCNMMLTLGYEVYSYHGEHPEMNATEHVTIYSDSNQEKWFGSHDYKSKFYNITWNPNDDHWVTGNNIAIEEIKKRYKKNDIICLIAGWCQKQIADAFPDAIIVEYGIGYTGVFANFKVFESYSHMHWVYGNMQDDNGKFYDTVIPNYFDKDDFKIKTKKEDYYLFIGRLIQRKGVEIAVETTRRLGKKLIMAGQGVAERGENYIVAEDGMRYEGDHIEHIGSVRPEKRSDLMSKAIATFVPTTYIEPFGGVAVESMFCGTPVIASDFGAFTETVIPDLSGYRFRTIGEATEAAKMVKSLHPLRIREYAIDNFSTDNVKYKYHNYFMQLLDLYNGGGFYSDWSGNLHTRYGVQY